MNTLRNKVQLIGNLGMDPEVRTTESGKKFVKLSIATNEMYKNAKGEWVKDTQWHNLIAWGKLAEKIEKQFAKGDEVAVEGKLMHRQYMDKSGTQRYITEVQVNEALHFEKKAA